MNKPSKINQPLKIGFVLDDTLDKPDGVQRYIVTLGAWLQSQGHEVHYLVSKTVRTDIANVHSLSGYMSLRYNRNNVRIPLPTSTRAIKKLLAAEDFDVLHVQMPYHPLLAAKIINSAASHAAVVGTFHIAPFSPKEARATRLLGTLLRTTLRRFDAVMSVSEPAQTLAGSAFKMESVVVPNMVDISYFAAPTKVAAPPVPHIVFLGRLVERKGCRQFLAALQRLHEAYPELLFRASICGSGPQQNRLEAYVHEQQLAKVVEFVGQVSEDQKRAYLQQAAIAVFPALGGESFGIVLLEAMAAGSGVVLAGDNPGYTSVMGGIPEAVVNPRDSRAFADVLRHFLRDQAAVRRVHAAQQRLVQQYDVPVVGNQVLRVYQAAIAKRRPQAHNTTK